jgi:HAD superfamily phosphoserine phosphatase-like hydrolase
MQYLAIYDMDKTITRAPTWTAFLIHAARRRAPWRLALLPFAGIATLGYALGLLDRGGLKQATQRIMLGERLSHDAATELAESYADEVTHTNTLEMAQQRIAADRDAGYRLVMATASHGYYARAIGARLGFDDVVATEARRNDEGDLLSLIEGENCYGPAKLRMIEAWMAREGIARGEVHVRAYSDHVSDAPLLGWADQGFAVNAHGPLRKLAIERGWEMLDWRGEGE